MKGNCHIFEGKNCITGRAVLVGALLWWSTQFFGCHLSGHLHFTFSLATSGLHSKMLHWWSDQCKWDEFLMDNHANIEKAGSSTGTIANLWGLIPNFPHSYFHPANEVRVTSDLCLKIRSDSQMILILTWHTFSACWISPSPVQQTHNVANIVDSSPTVLEDRLTQFSYFCSIVLVQRLSRPIVIVDWQFGTF